MSQFNWWIRSKKKPPLQKKDAFIGKSFTLQQIEHGDYDPSDYLRQAKHELVLAKEEQAKITKSWTAGPESLKHKLHTVELKYIKRYNKLMEDYDAEEQRLLKKLREALVKEFNGDYWEQALKVDKNQDLIQFFNSYRKIALQKQKENDKQNKELELE